MVKADRYPGDADDSGTVALADVIALLQHAAGEEVRINKSNADVNADGEADIHDALLIMQYMAGWSVVLK